MKKIMVCMMVALGTTSLAMAQTDSKFKFSFGPELSLATGAFSDTHSFGIGGSVQAEVLLQEHLYGTATFGIIAYNGKSIPYTSQKATGQIIMPLRVGAKYFFGGGFYGAAQIGVGILNNYYTGTAFSYSPQLGYEFKTKTDKAIDASFKYDGYSKNGTLGAVGVRIAYIF
ncbi:hypothetical protein BH11BAC5_BH11BAC5_02610 [soil metagenome]